LKNNCLLGKNVLNLYLSDWNSAKWISINFNFRTTSTGICSGAARIGAITGIMIGELNLLHSSFIVNTLAAIVTLLSAVLIKILPDMTKERMPVALDDISKVQFPEMFRNESENKSNNVEMAESWLQKQ
jgi:hypothetical protein